MSFSVPKSKHLGSSESSRFDDDDYWVFLTSLSISDLKSEPKNISQQLKVTEKVLHDLSLDHYRVFIINRESVNSVRKHVKEMSKYINDLKEKLSVVTHNADTYSTLVSSLLDIYRSNDSKLNYYLRISEYLSVPHMISAVAHDAKIMSDEDFDRIVSISNYVFQNCILSRERIPQNLSLFLQDSTVTSLEFLSSSLRLQLGRNLSLATSLVIVRRLRRLGDILNFKRSIATDPSPLSMQTLSEKKSSDEDNVTAISSKLLDFKIKAAYLEAKEKFLIGEIRKTEKISRFHFAHLPKRSEVFRSNTIDDCSSAAYALLTNVIEMKRTNWFEIITQYQAIFGVSVDQLLFSWCFDEINRFIQILRDVLPFIKDCTMIRSLLEQTMSFGSSMGRLGLDFRLLIEPIYTDAVLSYIAQIWAHASSSFEESLTKQLALNSAAPVISLSSSNASADDSSAKYVNESVSPPPILLNYPLVANYINGILIGLNNLRECCLLDLKPTLEAALISNFNRIAQLLKEHKEAMTDTSEQVFSAIENVLIPFMSTVFAFVYHEMGSPEFVDTRQNLLTSLGHCLNEDSGLKTRISEIKFLA